MQSPKVSLNQECTELVIVADRYVIVETKEKFHSREKRGLEFAKTTASIFFS